MRIQNSIYKMLTKCSTLLVLLGLIYLSTASGEPDVAQKSVNIAPTSLIYIGNTMYYIEDRTARNWFDARKSCESMGYNLISLDTNEKFNAINSYLDNRKDTSIYWTSGNDLLTRRHVWFPSGKPVPSNFWYPGEPNNNNNAEHCDEFRYKKSRLMNDGGCTTTRYYICERTLN